MKKILTIVILLVLPVTAWGQIDLSILTTIDVDEIANCDKTELECQVKISNIQQLITLLIIQIIAEDDGGGENNTDSESSVFVNETYGENYYQRNSYKNGLELSVPLLVGERKKFGLRGLKERQLDLRGKEQGVAHPIYMEYWRIFSSLIPERIIGDFDSVTFINDIDVQYSAHLYTKIKSSNNIEYELTINLAYLNLKNSQGYNESVKVLVHEAAHAISINKDQFKFRIKSQDCDEDKFYLVLLDGCSEEGSYYESYSNFWDDDFKQHAFDMDKLDGVNDFEKKNKKQDSYYNKNSSDFVSNYAARNLYEDIAESMTEYLTGSLPEEVMTVAEQKIMFFDNFVELRELKKQIELIKK